MTKKRIQQITKNAPIYNNDKNDTNTKFLKIQKNQNYKRVFETRIKIQKQTVQENKKYKLTKCHKILQVLIKTPKNTQIPKVQQ